MYPNLKDELEKMKPNDLIQIARATPTPRPLPVCLLSQTLNTFPPEVWQLVLRWLDSRSVYNASQTSRFLRELLEGAKPTWRFHSVLPLLLPYLGTEEALKLRLVCQHWMTSLDDHVKNKNCIGNRLPRSVALKKLTFPIDLSNGHTVQKWASRLEKYPNFQCIGWSVQVKYSRFRDWWWREAVYLGNLAKLLKLFGPQILSMEITPPSCSTYSNDQYLLICGILRLCPNLRKLKIGRDKRNTDFWHEDSNYPLYDWACINTLPCLSHLKSLTLLEGLWTSIKTVMLNTYGGQVTQLRANFWTHRHYPRLEGTLQRFSNVRELSIETQRLCVDFVAYYSQENHDCRMRSFSEIFGLRLEMLLQLASEMNLTRLSVTNPKENYQELVDSENPNLLRKRIRSVKYLEFSDMRGIPSFNFLVCFPSLEELHLKGHYSKSIFGWFGTKLGVSQKVPETVEIRKFLYEPNENSMYFSNVWTLLPALKTIVYEYEWSSFCGLNTSPGPRKVFTRDRWIDYRQALQKFPGQMQIARRTHVGR